MAEATAKVRIKADTDVANRKLQAFAKSVTGVLGVATGAYAIRGLSHALIDLGSDAQETRGKFTAVFKEQTAAALEFVRGTATALHRSKLDLEDWMATFQDTFVPLGFARREARTMAQTLTRLSIDLASFNNKTEPEVIRDLQSAMVGNHETMRKYGVIITAATLDQQLLNMGITGGVRAATEQQKAMARLQMILASTTDAQGDAARTAGSFANQSRAVKAQLKDLGVELGSALMPALQSIMPYFDNLKLKIDLFAASTLLGFVSAGNEIAYFAGTVVPAYVSYFGENWQSILVDLGSWFATAFVNIGQNVWDFLVEIKNWLTGDGFNFEWTGLLEGFERTTAKMAQIADRQLSPLENALANQVIDLQNQLTTAQQPSTSKPTGIATEIAGLSGTVGSSITKRDQNQEVAAVESRFLSGKTVKTATDKNTETLVQIARKQLQSTEKMLTKLQQTNPIQNKTEVAVI